MQARLSSESGFTLVEALIAATLMAVAMGIALSSYQTLSATSDGAMLISDMNASLRSTLNLMTRDLLSAGRGVPTGGIPIPSGANAAAIVRPSADGMTLTFPVTDTTLAAVTPGQGLGAPINGTATDIITILMSDTSLALDSVPLSSVSPDGSTVVVDPSVPIGTPGSEVTAGDLIMLSNALGNAIQMVTGRTGQTIEFGNGDPMRLNQPGAGQGTVMQLQSGPGTYPPTTATRVLMISYYIDGSDPGRPLLMRRVNLRPDRAIGVAIENLQITYDLVDGVTNPVNVVAPAPPNTPHQIRKANVFLQGRSHRIWTRTQQFLRSSLSTQVSLRSLSFVDRYQ